MTEIRSSGKILLFLSSFAPLWGIFFGNLILKYGLLMFDFENIVEPTVFILEWGFLVVLIISLISTGQFLREIRSSNNPNQITIANRENITGEYVLYVVTYIIPFLMNNFENEQIFTLIVMLIFVGILYVRANHVHVNPLFALFGYRLYLVTDTADNKIHLLSKRSLFRNDEVRINMIDNGFYAEVD